MLGDRHHGGLNKLTLGEPSRTHLANARAETRFDLLPITLERATAVEASPFATATRSTGY